MIERIEQTNIRTNERTIIHHPSHLDDGALVDAVLCLRSIVVLIVVCWPTIVRSVCQLLFVDYPSVSLSFADRSRWLIVVYCSTCFVSSIVLVLVVRRSCSVCVCSIVNIGHVMVLCLTMK